MSVKFNFSGKVVLITGSSSGIGAATALLLSRSGAHVVVTGTNADKVSETAKQCQKVSPNGLKALEVVANVTIEDDLNRLVNTSIKEFGKLDVLVNNVGIGTRILITDPNYHDNFEKLFDINLLSVLTLTKLCVPYLEKTKGNVVNISSVSAILSFPNLSPYCMSKASLDMFTKCMAVELGHKDIRVNSVNPGVVKSPFHQRVGINENDTNKLREGVASKYPVGRVGLPEDIANAVVFLASEGSSFITGTMFVVDGGHIAANVTLDKND